MQSTTAVLSRRMRRSKLGAVSAPSMPAKLASDSSRPARAADTPLASAIVGSQLSVA